MNWPVTIRLAHKGMSTCNQLSLSACGPVSLRVKCSARRGCSPNFRRPSRGGEGEIQGGHGATRVGGGQ
jgi:hypothetical protein